MSDAEKTREQLLAELSSLRARLARLEGLESLRDRFSGEQGRVDRFVSAILSTSGVLISALDRDHRFVFWNEGAERLTGYPRQEVLGGKGVLETIYPDEAYRERVARVREDVMRGRPSDGLPLTVRTKDGERRTIAFYSRAVLDERGDPDGLVNVGVDVTESERASGALRESEERFRSLFESMTEGVALHRLLYDEAGAPADYLILGVNPAFEAHTGIRPEAAIGRKASELYGAYGAPYLDVFARVAVTREPARMEVYFEPMGKHFRILVVSPAQDRFATVFEDITERKRIEAAFSETVAALQARNEELDAYAMTVAHDLNNPVAAVLGNAEMLGQELGLPPGDARLEGLDAIARSARKMLTIIDELLLLGDVRKATVQGAPLEMGVVVAECLRSLQHVVRESGAEVRVPRVWPRAVGHAPWVEQVWINYVGNALKYGGRPPRVELGGEPLPDGTVRFWVSDNGDGVPGDQKARLFTPFTRLAEGSQQGHGLGLSIVRRIVEKMGGKVGVESSGTPGGGCTFTFSLPGAV